MSADVRSLTISPKTEGRADFEEGAGERKVTQVDRSWTLRSVVCFIWPQ
jgi:hypothetical protein